MRFTATNSGTQSRLRTALILAASFLLPVACLGLVLIWLRVIPFGEKTFLVHDMNQMYSDMLGYLHTVVSGENDQIYTFSKNLGGDFLGIAAYYIGSPINFLVTLFPQRSLPLAVTLLVCLRYGFAGLTMNIFLQGTRTLNGFSSVIFSSAYALSAYMVINSENLHYTDGVVLLPLVLFGLQRLLSSAKPFLFVAALAAAIWVNYYIGFMICLFVVLFAVHQVVRKAENNLNATKNHLTMFISASLLAAGLTAIRLIPALLQLTDGQKAPQINAMNFSFQFGMLDFLSRNVTGAFDDFQIKFGLPSIYSGVTISVWAALFFFNRHFTVRERIVRLAFFCLMFLSFSVRILNLFWHGGSEPIWWQYRNAFLFVFLLVWTAADSWRERNGISRRALWIIPIALGIAAGILLKRYSYVRPEFLLLDLVIGCTIVFFASIRLKRRTGAETFVLMLLTAFLLTLNCCVILKQNLTAAASAADFTGFYDRVQALTEKIKSDDADFYRIEKNFERTINDPLQFGYNGLSHYSSTAKPAVLKLFERLGLNQTQYWTRYGQGGTSFADSLLAVRYLLWEKQSVIKPYPVTADGDIQVLRNPAAFPAAFMVDKSVILTENPQSRNVFVNQNRLFAALGKTDESSSDPLLTAIASEQIRLENVSAGVPAADGQITYQVIDASKPAWIDWQLMPARSEPAYVYFITDTRKNADMAEILRDGISLGKHLSVDRFGILPIGQVDADKTVQIRVMLLADSVIFAEPLFYSEDPSKLAGLAAEIQKRQIPLGRIGSSELRGELTGLAQAGYAFFSIPFEDDWQAQVDGVNRSAVEVFGGLMAVPVRPDEREILLRYIPRGAETGKIISLISLFLTLGWAVLRKTKPVRWNHFILRD